MCVSNLFGMRRVCQAVGCSSNFSFSTDDIFLMGRDRAVDRNKYAWLGLAFKSLHYLIVTSFDSHNVLY